MKKYSKRYNAVIEKIKDKKVETLENIVDVLKEASNGKFDETCELAFYLGLDLKKIQQPVRGSVNLPFGSGRTD